MAQRFGTTAKSAELVRQILKETERTAKTTAVRKVISNGARDLESPKRSDRSKSR